MRKIILLIVAISMLSGCMTANQLEAEKSFYQAMIAVQAQKAAQPIFELTAQDKDKPIVMDNVAKLTVFAPPAAAGIPLAQYQQKDYVQPWLNLFGSVVSVAVPWIGAASIVNSIKDIGGGNSYTQTISGTGNVGKLSGPSTISGVITNSTVGGTIDNTSTPTVVEQPAPIIVTQPAPIIVTP